MNQGFPENYESVGKRIEFLSRVVLPAGDVELYLKLMTQLLADDIHYIDPVHELRSRASVISMLKRVVPRVVNSDYSFDLLVDSKNLLIWRWRIVLPIRFTPFRFTIHGLVHAQIEGEKITRQREYFDPMESIGVIPIVGWFYKLVLRMG